MDHDSDDDAVIPKYPPTKFFISPKVFWNRDVMGSNLPIQHQGFTYACTSFALVTVLHSYLYFNYGVRCKLSIQQLADHFSLRAGVRPPEGVGVYLPDATAYVEHCGLLLDSEYPWRGSMQKFVIPDRPVDIYKSTFSWIPESSFRKQLRRSPLVATINFDDDYYKWVNEGSGQFVNEIYIPKSWPVSPLHGHTVVVVGYGFDDTSGYRYYVVQDSWGDSQNAGYKKIFNWMFTEGAYYVEGVGINYQQFTTDDAYIRLANHSV